MHIIEVLMCIVGVAWVDVCIVILWVQIEVELLQRSQAKLREMEKLGQVLDKKG